MGVNKTQDKSERTAMERLKHKRGRRSREELQQLQAERGTAGDRILSALYCTSGLPCLVRRQMYGVGG